MTETDLKDLLVEWVEIGPELTSTSGAQLSRLADLLARTEAASTARVTKPRK